MDMFVGSQKILHRFQSAFRGPTAPALAHHDITCLPVLTKLRLRNPAENSIPAILADHLALFTTKESNARGLIAKAAREPFANLQPAGCAVRLHAGYIF